MNVLESRLSLPASRCRSDVASIDGLVFETSCKRVNVLYLESMLWPRAAPYFIDPLAYLLIRSLVIILFRWPSNRVNSTVMRMLGQRMVGVQFPMVLLVFLFIKFNNHFNDHFNDH